MAGLDDPRMDRPDRDLVQPGALGGEKGVARRLAAGGGGRAERMADRPTAVVEPRTGVGRAAAASAR